MRRGSSRRLSSGLCACFVALLLGCSDDPSAPPRPVISYLRVSAATSGSDIDTNGYLVILDSREPLRLPPNGSVLFDSLGTGTHYLTVTDVEPNCVVGGGPLNVGIAALGDSAHSDLQITCSALGTVQVTVSTTGADVDENGYAVIATATSMPNSVSADIGTSEGTAVLRLTAGHYVARLTGVAANCAGDFGPRELDVVSGATQSLAFAIVCERIRRLAYVAPFLNASSEIFTVRSDGRGITRLTNNDAADTDPAWSPDGARIAFTSERDGGRAVYVMKADGSDVKALTPVTGNSFHPTWSPDGSRIAFVSVRDGNTDVYVRNTDGTGEVRLTSDPAPDKDPAWSPDGAKIAFSSERDGNAEIYVMNADGSGVTRLTTNTTPDGHPAWSPDGTRLAFSSTRCDGTEPSDDCYPTVFIAGPTGPPVEIRFAADPAWSYDGRKIAVTRFTCDYYYYYYDLSCSIVGIWTVVSSANGTSGPQYIWDSQVTAGPHGQPAWQP